jgi:protoporphyrinogen/coproporphyrinogen III oxidase
VTRVGAAEPGSNSLGDGSALGTGAAIAIVGGGISGLSAAWQLCTTAPRGTRVVVLEASDRVGGLLRSTPVGDRQVDVGADAFLARRPEAKQLCDELGISSSLVAPGSGHASVWARGSLRKLPEGLVLGVPTRLGSLAQSGIISATGVVRASLDLVLPASEQSVEDISVGEIVGKRLGNEVKDLVVGPLVGGINAGRVDELSAAAVFPALFEAYRRGGSLMHELRPDETTTPGGGGAGGVTGSAAGGGGTQPPVFLTPTSGMASIPIELRDALVARGVEIATSEQVEAIVLSDTGWSLKTSARHLDVDAVIVAAPARISADLLANTDSELSRLLRKVKTASVVVVTLRFEPSSLRDPLDGTGFLVPAVDGNLVTACTFLTTKWPHTSRRGDLLLRASVGRTGDDRTAGMSDEQIISAVSSELGQMLGDFAPPQEAVVSRFAESFPQYLVGHNGWVASVDKRVGSHRGLALAGSSYQGIGVPACIASGRRAAKIVLEELELASKHETVPAAETRSTA